MRTQFDSQLTQLTQRLIEMGALMETVITMTCTALTHQDVKIAKEAMRMEDGINGLEKEIEGMCLKLLLQQQPVARDLRTISAALKMLTDMERIGDQARDICELSIYLADVHYIKELVHIPQMATATIHMVTGAIDAFVKKDIKLAKQIIDMDDVVDDLFGQIKNDLIDLIHQNAQNGSQALDLLMIAKYFERIGDHAVNIAEWVLFSLTGKHHNERIL